VLEERRLSPGRAQAAAPGIMMENRQVAQRLERLAELLELRDESPHRVRAYRRAAAEVREEEANLLRRFLEGGEEALRELPGVGKGISGVIAELLRTGGSRLLRELEADLDPVRVFSRIPGISLTLARRVVDHLGLGTLEDLEQAAYDGRLLGVEGFGAKRVQGVREMLAARLSRGGGWTRREEGSPPPVELLLEIDAQYRRLADQGALRMIAPRRFNPNRESWLPVLEVQQGEWEFTVLFSNTAQAHERGKTHDWVVVYYESGGREGQCTVVTASEGSLEGKRVIRGRERDCRLYHSHRRPAP
jgi:DNA polymerase (family 10)